MPSENLADPNELDHFRPYLRLLASLQIEDRFRAKFDTSDIVQMTLVKAHRARNQFRGRTRAEVAGWLRAILSDELAQTVRHHQREKRSPDREQSLEASLAESSRRLEHWLASVSGNPAHEAERQEQLLRLASSLECLTDDQREAIQLFYWHELSLAEIAERLERSREAVGGLIYRGVRELRRQLCPTP